MKTRNLERLFKVINNSLFMTTGKLDYDRITAGLILLANGLYSDDNDSEEVWYIGEGSACCMDELIVGAYWHYSEWHCGQDSIGYAALSALGRVFSPGMSSAEEENEAYQQLGQMAGEYL